MSGPARVSVGHATDEINQTGCTVVMFDRAVPCVVDVRGGAPGTRETDLLRPGKLVQQADAIVLSGGSAFGLATADGVMTYLREQERGFPTAASPVPIVPAAILYDLATGHPVAPTATMGYVACLSAEPIERAQWGAVGAGRGTTTDKITGTPLPGGIGIGSADVPGGTVIAITAVNAFGIAGFEGNPRPVQQELLSHGAEASVGESTTLVVVLVDAPVHHDHLHQIAVSAHDGMTRAVVPCHTPFDGDLVFAVALGKDASRRFHDASLCIATEMAVEDAIRHAITVSRSSLI
jgi:L-aminopeptidase/D-esterase-like protein